VLIFNKVKLKSLSLFVAREKEQAPDRLDGPTFATNDSAVIVRRYRNADLDVLASVRVLGNLNHIRRTNKPLDYFFDRFFHNACSRDGSINPNTPDQSNARGFEKTTY